jgi:GT2 family glycosyltransferase
MLQAMDQAADARTVRIEDIASVRTLRNRIVIDLGPRLPADEMEAVFVTGTRSTRLPRTSLRVMARPEGGEIVTITTDLSPWFDAPESQLQLWIGSYLIYQDRVFPEGTTLSGRIESVSDYALTGWASDLRGGRLPEGELLLDRVPVARLTITETGSDEDTAGSLFRIPLPPEALDGASHTLQVRFGQHTLAPFVWRAAPRFRVLRAEPGELRLWFCDLATTDGPATITVIADDTTIFQGQTISAAAVAAAPSHRVIRFEARFDLPHTARRLDIRAGGLGQLLLGSYEIVSADLVTEAARAAAAALLRLERGLARHLGWDRGTLAALRTAGDAEAAFGRALSPIRSARTRGVSVIVPIYKGLDETRACLESLYANVHSGADPALREIILIDDRSPEPGMAELIARFSGAVGQCEIRVISNPENLGFVGTVNHGISLAEPDNDVILLNADTVVPLGFATRLQKAAQHDPRTASVTPLSNNATILSLPDANAVNDISVADVPALDEFLRTRGNGETLEIPTGVGFCLFLARDALDDVGGFGMEWGRGYGEEVDWCLRARDRGWINVAALDVFVLHFGSVSFGTDERRAILERNHAQLERRYPEYIAQVQTFLRTDALAGLRRAVFFHLLAKDSAPRLIHLLHGMGGGTMTYVDSVAALTGAQGWTNLIVMPRHDDWLGRDEIEIRCTHRNLSLRLSPEDLPSVLTELGNAQGFRRRQRSHPYRYSHMAQQKRRAAGGSRIHPHPLS